MTHIEQMIQDMCPYGVEYKKLGEVCTCTKGEQLNKSGLLDEGYPVINGGINPSGYWSEYNYPANTITISQGGASAGYVNFQQTPFWAGAHCYVLIDTIPEIDYKFLYYLVKQNEPSFMQCQYGAGIPALGAKTVNSLEIPLPPLEIQKKIVECLDKFSALAAELQAELQMRRKQYEYYRTQLLTPHSDGNSATKSDDAQWEWKTLGEVCEIGTGSHNTQDGLTEGDFPFYTRGTEILRLNTYDFDETAIITAGDGAGVGKVFHYVQGKYALHQRAYRIIANRDHLLPRFLYHYMRYSFYDYIMKNSVSSSVTSVRKPMLEAYPIPLPPISEQNRIVSILDKFEALTTSLSDGIPAEQAAQQKRYEYYRDLLLTFPRKAV